MERVFVIAEQPLDKSLFVAIAIGESESDQRHIGILHRTQGSAPEFLHLAWHCRLHNDALLPDYMTLWVRPAASTERLRSVAALCRRIWKKHSIGGIPYAFSKPTRSIDATTGEHLQGPSQFGLTCASFVLAVFQATGLQLAEYETWPTDRPGDREWQQQIIEKLAGRATPEHIEHLRNELGAVRFRPEEVAAAATLAPPPANFEPAAQLGLQIADKLRIR